MKIKRKKLLLTIFCLVLFFVIIFALFFAFKGCSNKNSQKTNGLENYLSEYRKNLFVGKTSNYLITFTSGQRESTYIMDGECSNLVDFGVITIKFNSAFGGQKLQYELKVNDDTYTGELEINPYDKTLVADIQRQVDDNAQMSIYLVDFDETIELQCWSKNFEYNYKDALEIFAFSHKEAIENNTLNGTLNGEIYIKLVAENNNMNDIYWFVCLVFKNSDTTASLISVKTGQILQNT